MAYDPRSWLSVSKLKSVTKCGRAYELERIQKVPSRPAAWTVRGIATHDAIEQWEKSGRDIDIKEYFNQSAWPAAYEQTLEKYPDLNNWLKTPRVKSVSQDLVYRHLDGLEQSMKYTERAIAESDLWRVVETEVPFTLEFPGQDFIINGYIDQIREWNDGDLSIWDIKSGNDDSEDNRQLGVYGLGYYQKTGTKISDGCYWYTKLNRPSKSIDLTIYTEEYIIEEFSKLDQIIKSGLFLANPSIKGCFACGVADHCLESKQ